MTRDEIIARYRNLSHFLIVGGAPYAIHIVGDWYEVDSRSDGMCGRVDCENPVTTEHQSFHWSVTHPTCQSQYEAREAARRTFTAELEPAP